MAPRSDRRWAGQRVGLGGLGFIGNGKAASTMPVMIHPGQMALQRTAGPWSTAIERVRPCTKALDAL